MAELLMVEINGTKLPSPSVYRIPEYDLDSEDSGRNESGRLVRTRLRQGVKKVELEWFAIDNSKATTIMNTIKPTSVNVKLLDFTGNYTTKKMYVGDRNIEMVRFMNSYDKMAWNVSFNLTEY